MAQTDGAEKLVSLRKSVGRINKSPHTPEKFPSKDHQRLLLLFAYFVELAFWPWACGTPPVRFGQVCVCLGRLSTYPGCAHLMALESEQTEGPSIGRKACPKYTVTASIGFDLF
jgi:hypothetical protein